MMVYIAYDNVPLREFKEVYQQQYYLYTGECVAPGPAKPSYYFDQFTRLYFPLNGAHIESTSYYKMHYLAHKQIKQMPYKIPLTQPDFHSSLPATLLKNNIDFKVNSVSQLIKKNLKFVYNFTLRYFYFEHYGQKINNSFLTKKNYLKDLLTKKIIQEYNNGNVLLLFNDVVEGTLYNQNIFNTIKEFLNEIGITNFNNIVIVTSNPKSVSYNEQPFKIIYWQYFETATQQLFLKRNVNINYSKKLDQINDNFYKFLLLNNKPRPHRFYLCYKIWNNNSNFANDFCASCKYREESYEELISTEYIKNNSYIKRIGSLNFFNGISKITDSVNENFNEFYKMLPLVSKFDLHKINNKRYFNFWDQINDDMYLKTGIQIITETLVEHNEDNPDDILFLTEKIFKPIAAKSPFILYAKHNSLKLLKSQGYQTFDKFWSEEYDNIVDPVERADNIAYIVRQLQGLSTGDFKQLMHNLQPIIEHNFNTFITRIPEQELIDTIAKFYEQD